MSCILIQIIKAYQITVGRLLPRVCRFEPTCSNYAVRALHEHGFLKGLSLSLWRIIRCNPFFAGGSDPVPKRTYENE